MSKRRIAPQPEEHETRTIPLYDGVEKIKDPSAE